MAKIAVIKTGGKQYKIKEGDKLKIEKIEGEVGSKVNFDKVLLIADEDGKALQIGKPEIAGAKIEATISDQGRDKKLTIIKYKAKVRYRRKIGHRQHFTKVTIGAIA